MCALVRCCIAVSWETITDSPTFLSDPRGSVFVPYVSKLEQFRRFLLRSNRYKALTLTASGAGENSAQHERKIVLVEDLPFLGNPDLLKNFNNMLLSTLEGAVYPMVFVITDHQDKVRCLVKVVAAGCISRFVV